MAEELRKERRQILRSHRVKAAMISPDGMRPRASVSTSLSTRIRRPLPSSIVTMLVFLRGRDTGVGTAGVDTAGNASTTSTWQAIGRAAQRPGKVLYARGIAGSRGYQPTGQSPREPRRVQDMRQPDVLYLLETTAGVAQPT